MKRWFAATLLVLVAAGAAWAGEAPDAPREGTAILSADRFDLAGYSGQVVLLDFWASWCKPCQESMPWLGEMQRKLGPRGLQVVAVNLDRKLESARGMLEAMDPGIVIVHDPEGRLAASYELQGMPSSFVYDRKGKLVGSHVGFLPSDCQDKEAELVELLGPATGEVDGEK